MDMYVKKLFFDPDRASKSDIFQLSGPDFY